MAAPGGYPRGYNGGYPTHHSAHPYQVRLPPPPPYPQQIVAAPPAAADDSDSDDDDDDEGSSPIVIDIVSPLYVKGDNNVITVDPSYLSQRIATAVAMSLNKMAGEIPMIDENGAPREIRVSVHAETRIDGNMNLVGAKLDGFTQKALSDKPAILAVHPAPLTNGTATNGTDANGGGKRKSANINDAADDGVAPGLGIKLEPNGSHADDHGVKRPRLE